ncbi:MAG TPA: 5-(carboxyamino)imidazole ribonucleotide mutase [Clostridia bacterium]|nr:5-(carboxyamino)imidazole ribonucleotide mutase [Clostridia bacterium]
MPQIVVVMGSDTDLPVLEPAFAVLRSFPVTWEARVISAHRTPGAAMEFARGACGAGVQVIIAAAGKAAHLAGALAASTTLPVIGIPISSPGLGGLDALLATVQMPTGVPVATVGIDNAKNAALLALQIVGLRDARVAARLLENRQQMAEEVGHKDQTVREHYGSAVEIEQEGPA